MKLVLSAAIVALFLIAPVASANLVPVGEVTQTSRYLVGFFETPAYAVGDSYLGDAVVAVDTDLNFIVVETSAPALLAAKVQLDAAVRYFEPDASDHQLQLTPNDPKWTDAGHYGAKIIGAPIAWDKTLGTSAVKVVIVDSGIRATHEDIAGRILAQYDFYNNDGTADDSNYCSYHGSHTAGTSLATTNNGKGMAGIAQSGVMIAKIFQGKSPSPMGGCATTTTAIVNALKWGGDQGAAVSSNSWGGGSFSTAINDAITYTVNKGTTIVAAAGNSGSCTNCVGEPWKSATAPVIVVSCTTATDAFCSFSSQGPQVDVAAPGQDILSINGGGDTSYKLMSGTSMSTPHVSGVAALVKTLNPGFGPTDIEARLKGTAKNLGMISDRQGAGRLDAAAAVY
ncbi:MAG TPA: S8 family serine peptidase [Candidatus Thermoplasmatota archaeon]|nr:S8 family serine peptidase [Candidatus Thermoplasmatota archaeon]